MHTSVVLILTETLDSLMTNKDMFTCFDVTRILRDKRGCKVDHQEVRELVHSLNGTNLPPFRNSGYVRNSQVHLKNFGVSAEVYALAYLDAGTYDPGALDPNKSVAPSTTHSTLSGALKSASALASSLVTPSVPAPAPLPTLTRPPVSATFPPLGIVTGSPVQAGGQPGFRSKRSTAIDSKRMVTCADNRGRVTIHNKFVQSAGMKRGSVAYVAKRNGGGTGLVVMDHKPRSGLLGSYLVDKSGNVRITRKILQDAGLAGTASLKMRLADNRRAVILLPA